MHSSSISEPCSIDCTPARTAFLIPSAPWAWAVTFAPYFAASAVGGVGGAAPRRGRPGPPPPLGGARGGRARNPPPRPHVAHGGEPGQERQLGVAGSYEGLLGRRLLEGRRRPRRLHLVGFT